MKKNIYRYVPILFIIGIIFIFSSQPYSKQEIASYMSGLNSSEFLKKILSPISFQYGGHDINIRRLGVARFIEFFIRKFAHLSIFALLAFFTIRASFARCSSKRKAVTISFSLVVVYAMFDEFHQMFTKGRTPLVEDIIVDSIGGILGILLFLYMKSKRNNSKLDNTWDESKNTTIKF